MASQIGMVKADGVNVTVSEYLNIVRIVQGTDIILMVDVDSLEALIEKLQKAKCLITAVKKA